MTWLLAIQAHKQARAMLKHLLQPLDQAWIIPVPGHRSWDVNALLQLNPDWHSQLHQADDADSALVQIEAQGSWSDPIPVVAGSLYLLGDLFRRKLVTAE